MNAKYRSRKNTKRKNYRRRNAYYKKIAHICKTVALRQQETKSIMESSALIPVYHNNSYNVATNLIDVAQNVSDSGRIGDHIILRGVKIYMQFESMYDRPNTTFRVVVGKARETVANLTNLPRRTITGAQVIDPVDTERVSKVYMNKRYRFGDKDTMIDVGGEGTSTLNRPTTHFRTFWIPLKNQHYQFVNATAKLGRNWNLPCWIAAYDHSSTLSLDHIGNVKVSWELFFKDG